jgi:hypothetical protein
MPCLHIYDNSLAIALLPAFLLATLTGHGAGTQDDVN